MGSPIFQYFGGLGEQGAPEAPDLKNILSEKEEGRRKKDEGGRKKKEGRRRKEEGRRTKEAK